MHQQSVLCGELPVTPGHVARVGSLPCVDPKVGLQQLFGYEGLGAVVAHKPFFARVPEDVDLQLLGAGVGLWTY